MMMRAADDRGLPGARMRASLAARVRAALAANRDRPIWHAGDDQWAARGAARGLDQHPRDAAVLVAIIAHARPALLLTRRTDRLRTHSGQVAFPGGTVDPADAGAAAAALREAQEEVGLPPAEVDLIGATHAYMTVTRYRVVPVIGVIAPGLPLAPNPGEVDRIFEVPIDIAFDPAQHIRKAVAWEGGMRHYHEIHHDGERIWGATAAMIRNLGVQLGLADAPDQWNSLAA